jgi:hypothetical protein
MVDENTSSITVVEPLLLPKHDIVHPGDIILPSSSPQTSNKERSLTNSQSSIDDKIISTNEPLII